MVKAISPSADSNDWWSLYTLGDGHSVKLTPPALQILYKFCWRSKVFCGQSLFTANFLFQNTIPVPGKDILRSRFVPAFYKASEKIIMIRILNRIAFALVNTLGIGKLSNRNNIHGALWYNLTSEYLCIQVSGQIINLMLPKICQST